MRLFDLIHFGFNSKARAFRDFYGPIQDSEWLAREPLSFLPDPMCVNSSNRTEGRGRNVTEHGQRNIEVAVGMRTPRHSMIAAKPRCLHRAGHGPEMRIGEEDVDGVQLSSMSELAPVRRLTSAIELIQGRKWHVQIYAALPVVAGLSDLVLESPVPVVFDHFGGAKAAAGLRQPGFDKLLQLVESGKA